MLYSIIPPIILVLALIGIIVMLMKKSSQVALIKEEESGGPQAEFSEGTEKEKIIDALKQKLSIILARITGIFKRGATSENRLQSWKEARRRKKAELEANESGMVEEQEDDHLMERIKRYEPERTEKTRRRISITNHRISETEEREVKPMISEKIVTPTPRAEMKDQLEKLLIERIASNPKDVEAYERLGEYYFEIGSFDYAKECFKQIIKLNPGNSNVKNKMRKLERLLMR